MPATSLPDLMPQNLYEWCQRVRAECSARNLTALLCKALIELVTYSGPDGLWPSDAEVARKATCSARTVQRARDRARELGLLSWQHSRKLCADGRWRQSVNRYELAIPDRPPSDGQVGRQRKKERKQAASCSYPQAIKTSWLDKRGLQPPLRTVAEQMAWLQAEIEREKWQLRPTGT